MRRLGGYEGAVLYYSKYARRSSGSDIHPRTSHRADREVIGMVRCEDMFLDGMGAITPRWVRRGWGEPAFRRKRWGEGGCLYANNMRGDCSLLRYGRLSIFDSVRLPGFPEFDFDFCSCFLSGSGSLFFFSF